MNIVLSSFLFTIFLNVVKCRILNKTIIIQQYGYSEDALLIDLNGLSIDSIEIGTFKDFSKLEVLYLDDNKISKIENGLYRFQTYEQVSKHFSSILIYYKELKYTLISQEPRTMLFNVISNIGGILGLFLGISFLSFMELVEILFQVIYIKCFTK